jgi:deoxyribodipyrimidine photo-lyase
MSVVIHWFRRDLRVSDNTALSEALRRGEQVVPVFILEDALRTGPDVGAGRLAFLLQSAEALRKNLAELGYPLVIRSGRSEELILQLCRETGARAVFANKRYEPYAQARDRRLGEALFRAGVEFKLFKDALVWEETEILTQSGQPYTVFTPYSKAWKLRPIPAPRPQFRPAGKMSSRAIPSETLPLDSAVFGHPCAQSLPPAGERAAREALRQFMAGPVLDYAAQRNFPAVAGTSQLSPHLRAGTIGIRTILKELDQARASATTAQTASCDVFLNELIWREFYTQVLFNFPHVTKGAFRPEYDRLGWSENQDHFTAWCAGRTGYPIVDAAMRCLNATGSMHNRLRMIVAMFLTKDLLINWQWGERYFMRQLVDGDMAANNGGWQWSAGTGTDAAPYFRIFNPITQGEKFDPEGRFVRQWVPELAGFPAESIHQPWVDPLYLAKTKYPDRIVQHDVQRELCLEMFKAAKGPSPLNP